MDFGITYRTYDNDALKNNAWFTPRISKYRIAIVVLNKYTYYGFDNLPSIFRYAPIKQWSEYWEYWEKLPAKIGDYEFHKKLNFIVKYPCDNSDD